jgi:RHS repeat-associated protein
VKKYLLALLSCLLAVFCFASEEQPHLVPSRLEQLAAFASHSSDLIGGLVSPVHGHFSLRETDLVVQGAQPISLSRVYLSPFVPLSFGHYKKDQEEHDRQDLYHHLWKTYIGWHFFPHQRLVYNRALLKVLLPERNGAVLEFSLAGSQTTLIAPAFASNYAEGEVSGRYDLRNTKIAVEANGEKIVVRAPDGSCRTYLKAKIISLTRDLFLLHKEVLPNGRVMKYSYREDHYLTRVESFDPEERHLYASLEILPQRGYKFRTPSGLAAEYSYEVREFYSRIRHRRGIAKSTSKIQSFLPHPLQSVSSPSYRFGRAAYDDHLLLTSYFGKDHQFTADYALFGSSPDYRVQRLNLPVGSNGSFQPVYEIDYDPPIAGTKEGITRVKRVDGSSIVYHFSKELLPISIDTFGPDGVLKKQKVFSWDGEHHWLTSIGIRDGQGALLSGQLYELDAFGNPALETIAGDLTGSGELSFYKIRRDFSQDGRNLLLREEHENGKVLSFSYLPNTNLVTRKLTQDRTQILRREFSRYDASYNLIETITDDGITEEIDDLTGATQRTMTRYLLRQEAPFLHMPEWIEEWYLEKGVEKLLRRSHLIYNRHGNIAQEAVYDADNHLAYSIEKEYNERGDLLSETNPSGQRAVYSYTDRGHRDFETNFSGRVQKSKSYDANGRLHEEIATGDDGRSRLIRFEYDFHDRPLQKVDSFGNSTSYSYDLITNQAETTHFPSVAAADGGSQSVVTHARHDALGRKVEERDANGNITTSRYNAYGSIAEVSYPDGGRESYRYERDGRLASYTDRDGLTTLYQRDLLDRPLSKSYLSSSGELLAQESFTYSGFHLLTESDKEGNITQYRYDGAGRCVAEERAGRLTEFEYDSLGRLQAISLDGLATHYKRDLEGRLLEESKSDARGNLLYRISYAYDSDGNRSAITRYIGGKESTQLFNYDSLKRLIEKSDSSSITRFAYDEGYVNGFGQRVLQTATTDPLGVVTLETRDALNRPVKEERFDSQGAALSCREMIYDPHGNLTNQYDHVFAEGQSLGTQSIQYAYTSTHRLQSWTQGEETTSYTYLSSGKIETKQFPDGVVLTYCYDPLGYLSHLSSSDGKIAHVFQHNRLGDLTYAADEMLGIAIERKVDPFGNVIRESLPHLPALTKKYDALDRLISLKIDGVGEIAYHYNPLFLGEVTRLSASGKELYRHRYDEYDEDGNLLAEQLIGGLGRVVHKTTARGQKAAVLSPYFTEKYRYDAVGNLTEIVADRSTTRYIYDGLSQLTQERGASQSQVYRCDSLYNRVEKNGVGLEFNDSNQLLSFGANRYFYDRKGNQLNKNEFRLTYDPLDRLVEATSEDKRLLFSYDPLGRRLDRTLCRRVGSGWKEVERECYLYDGFDEIGAFSSSGELKNLRVIGLNGLTVAVELGGETFASIVDMQRNIRQLIEPQTRLIVGAYEFTAFGEEVWKAGLDNPWRFASKRSDPDLGTVHFGKRDYDPEIGRWLTRDPAGFLDSVNLYQYVFNNPFRYCDPDGQFVFVIPIVVWGAGIALPTLSTVITAATYTAVTAAVVYGGCKVSQILNDRRESSYYGDSYALHRGKKKGGVDESLPEDPFSHPDWEDVSHPDAAKKGHYKFKDKKTGEIIEYDRAKPGQTGHKGYDHYHRPNPDSKKKGDEYLASKGRPVRDNSDPSHLYPPEWVWWN